MVNITQVRQSNAQLTAETVPRTSVFVGGTSGIGKSTLIELVSLGKPVKAYIVGRKATEPAMKTVLDDLRKKNAQAELVWLEGDISLLSEGQRVCNIIKAAGDPSIDFLCLTAGYAPFSGRNSKSCEVTDDTNIYPDPLPDTSEGLDVTHALEYFGRMLFTLHLLPLLRKSAAARVLTVLAGSMLTDRLIIDDLTLEKPSNFGGFNTQIQLSIMNSIFLDRLSADSDNANITFLHNSPGSVKTGNMFRHHTPTWHNPFTWLVLLTPMHWFMGHTEEESGQRHLYLATSGKFARSGPLLDGKATKGTTGREGSGLYILNYKCDVSYNEKALKALRAKGQDEVWKETMRILGPFL